MSSDLTTNNGGSMQTIPTRYAGCYFRSRLEARYAVFFDALGIRWEYEPQGFELDWRLALVCGDPSCVSCASRPAIKWLPDFRLPDEQLWVEVKGAWENDEAVNRFCNAAAGLANDCHVGDNVMILGPMPNPRTAWAPWVLHMHKGDLQAAAWGSDGFQCTGYGNHYAVDIARDVGGETQPYKEIGWYDLGMLGRCLLSGLTAETVATRRVIGERVFSADHRYADALTAGRSARFEYGQSGA